jgi:hypothetical protein
MGKTSPNTSRLHWENLHQTLDLLSLMIFCFFEFPIKIFINSLLGLMT